MTQTIVVIGGGAAGMMAALSAARAGGSVLLLEPNQKLGRKLYITGKGRCNITNDCTPEEALAAIPCNGKFLYSAMNRFPPSAVKSFFEDLGVPLKTERGGRVFPHSDKAADVIDALFFSLRRAGVAISQERATRLEVKGGAVIGVFTEKNHYSCERVILATGGLSYPLTGSTGDGYSMAEAVGHTIVTPHGSLVALEAKGSDCPAMQGLSLRNITLSVENQKGKVLYRDQGELLFTHFGMSGPLVLSASAHLRHYQRETYTAIIDLKPALDTDQLERRLLRDFEESSNQDFHNYLGALVARLMVPVVTARSGIRPQTKLHSITKEERRSLMAVVKGFTIPIQGPRPVEEAIVTTGGVKVGEVDPKTMASKLVSGLYFAGELLDVDGYTGGFNLQIAWATGRAAGLAVAQKESDV